MTEQDPKSKKHDILLETSVDTDKFALENSPEIEGVRKMDILKTLKRPNLPINRKIKNVAKKYIASPIYIKVFTF